MDNTEKEAQVKFTVLVPVNDLELLKAYYPRQVGPLVREFIKAQANQIRQRRTSDG